MSVRKNIVSLLLSQLATWAVSLVLLVEAPDRLGEDGFGALSFAAAFVGFFTLVASLGTGTFMTKEVARDHSLLRPWVHNAFVMKTGILVLLSAVAVPLAVLLGKSGDTLLLIVLGLVGMAFTIFNEVYLGALAGMEIMAKPAFFQVVQVYVSSGLGLLVLIMDWGLIAYGAVFALASVIPLVGNWFLLRPYLHGPRQRLDAETWRILVRGGIPLMALTFFNTIYGTIDVPILDQVSGEDTVAWYAMAYRWAGIPIFMATAVVSAYFPRFSAHGEKSPEFARLVNRAIRIVLLVSVPAAIGLAMVADDLVGTLYTTAYQPSVVLIQILAIVIPFAAMDTILAVALIAADRQGKYIFVSALAAVINPVACIWLIHWAERNHNNGAIGAALVTLGTELVVMIGALLLRSRGVLDRAASLDVGRIVAAGLVLVPLLLVAGDTPLLIQIACGVVAYALAAVLFRAITVTEIHDIVSGVVGSVTARRRRVPESVE
jgi:O-antigen/teichoic acid export membrane protein